MKSRFLFVFALAAMAAASFAQGERPGRIICHAQHGEGVEVGGEGVVVVALPGLRRFTEAPAVIGDHPSDPGQVLAEPQVEVVAPAG